MRRVQIPAGASCTLAVLTLSIAFIPRKTGAESQIAILADDLSATEIQSDRIEFLRWASEAAAPLSSVKIGTPRADLDPLGRIIGNATVVALSEGVHGAAEPLEFRNRVFQYLVEEKGFTAIAIESGIVESRTVYEYVRGGPGNLSTVVSEGLSWTFDRIPQNKALVGWIHDYNSNPRHLHKISFYGFDIPGSPGNPMANRRMDTALTEALKYLDRVDRKAAADFHLRLDRAVKIIQVDPHRAQDKVGFDLDESLAYDRLSRPERDTITAAIDDLIALFERREAIYTAVAGMNDYEWAYRSAIGARQVDTWLRARPADHRVPDDRGESEINIFEVRDRAQIDNFEWIAKQEGALGKILVFAHRVHISSMPANITTNGQRKYEVMGTYLRRRLGDRLLTIGNVIGGGDFGCFAYYYGPKQTLKHASPDSIDDLAGELGMPLFLLDLRAAPAPVKSWLNQEHPIGSGDTTARAFDVLFYIRSITPACSH